MDFNEFTPPSTSSTSHLNLFKFKRRDMIYLIFWWLSESVSSFLICIPTYVQINKFSDNLQTSQSLHSCRFFSLKVLLVIGRKWDCSVIIKMGNLKNLSVTSSEIQHLLYTQEKCWWHITPEVTYFWICLYLISTSLVKKVLTINGL